MSKLKAKDVMNREVQTVSASANLREVAEVLSEHRIGGAPVVDEKGAVVGMISESDLIDERKRRVAIPRPVLFGFWRIREDLLRDAYDEGLALRARDVMSRDVLSGEEETPIDQLAQLMVKRRINRIPILRGRELVGIVTREDVLRGLISDA